MRMSVLCLAWLSRMALLVLIDKVLVWLVVSECLTDDCLLVACCLAVGAALVFSDGALLVGGFRFVGSTETPHRRALLKCAPKLFFLDAQVK
jgi:hypothetical protein